MPPAPLLPDAAARFPRGLGSGQVRRYFLQKFLSVLEQFVVPVHQRLFSWEEKEVSELWSDLMWHYNANSGDLYSLGTIETTLIDNPVPLDTGGVGGPVDIPQLEVQDGQQRLTAFTLFILAYADSYGDAAFQSEVRAKVLREDGAGGKQPLVVYVDDDLNEAYRILCESGNLRAYGSDMSSHVRNIQNAYDNLKRKFDAVDEPLRTSFFNHVMNHTEIVHLCSNANPHLMFETRNSRGKKLGSLDLVKNFIERIDLANQSRGGPLPDLNFGVDHWYEAIKNRDVKKLNRTGTPYNVKPYRDEDALFKRAMTAAFGTKEANYSVDFRERFAPLIDASVGNLEDDLGAFIRAFDDMSTAMGDVMEPAPDWVTYGRLSKWEGGADYDEKRGHVLAILADIFTRLDLEVRWAPVVLTLYTKLEAIDDFIRCLKQIEKAAFRIYRYRSNSKTSFAAGPISELAKKIYLWDGTQPALVDKVLCEVAKLCLSTTYHPDQSTSLENMFVEISQGRNHYHKKWSTYLLYHYEAAQYKQLMLGSVTKSWQYNNLGGAGYYQGDYIFQKEHIMPNNLAGQTPITATTTPKWDPANASAQNNAPERGNSSYWIRTGPVYPWFSWDDTDVRSLKDSYNDFENYVHRIGNLVLSKHDSNNAYSNHPFIRTQGDGTAANQKRTLYLSQSDFRRVKNIPRKYTQWNKRTIEYRSLDIAIWAIRRFRLEIPDTCADISEDAIDIPALPFIPEHTEPFRQTRGAAFVAAHDGEQGNPENGAIGPMVEEVEEGGEGHAEPLTVNQPQVPIHPDGDNDDHPEMEPSIRLPEEMPGYDFPEDYYDPELPYEVEMENA